MVRKYSQRKYKRISTSFGMGLGFLFSSIFLFIVGYESTKYNLNFTIFDFIPVPWWVWLGSIYFSMSVVFFKISKNKTPSAEDLIGPFI